MGRLMSFQHTADSLPGQGSATALEPSARRTAACTRSGRVAHERQMAMCPRTTGCAAELCPENGTHRVWRSARWQPSHTLVLG